MNIHGTLDELIQQLGEVDKLEEQRKAAEAAGNEIEAQRILRLENELADALSKLVDSMEDSDLPEVKAEYEEGQQQMFLEAMRGKLSAADEQVQAYEKAVAEGDQLQQRRALKSLRQLGREIAKLGPEDFEPFGLDEFDK